MIALVLIPWLVAQEPEPAPPPEQEPGARLEELQALYDDVECGQMMARSPGVGLLALDGPQRTRLLFLEAACSVVLGNISDAAARLEVLVREDVNVAPPFPIEKRLTLLLNAARVEEQQRRAREAEDARLARVATVQLTAEPQLPVTGGQRVVFTAAVTDPNALVASMRVEFRKKGSKEFYSLPISRLDATTWSGDIPGRFTVTSQGMYLEWFVSASEADGTVLRTFGSSTKPHEIFVKPGADVATDLKADERLPHLTRVVYAGFGTSGIAAGAYVVSGTGILLVPFALSFIPNNFVQGLATALAVTVYAAGTIGAAAATWFTIDLLTDELWLKVVVAGAVAVAGITAFTAVAVGAAADLYVLPVIGPQTVAGVTGSALAAAVLVAPIGLLPATTILFEDHSVE